MLRVAPLLFAAGANAEMSALAAKGPVKVTAAGDDDVAQARWLVANTLYGIISTTSIHLNGAAFGNVNSFADGKDIASSTGRLFLYVSTQDASALDCTVNPHASFTISQESTNSTGCGGTDPEDPTCLHLTLSGKVVNLTGSDLDLAKDALFTKHPKMKSWPGDHAWITQELVATDIFFLDGYGGAKTITPDQYYQQKTLKAPASGSGSAGPFPTDKAPFFTAKEKTARWMIHQTSWGVLTTTSVHLNGTAFGNVVSLSDGVGLGKENSTGRLFFYLSPMDSQGADIAADPMASFTVSEANIPQEYGNGQPCGAGISKADPESPLCARLSLNGKMVKLAGSDAALAKNALFSKHPQMNYWPSGHEFAFWELQISTGFFIDMFGGADTLNPTDYYAVKL